MAVLMVLSVLALYFAQALLMPKYMSNVKEGALIAEYYKAPKNNDVIFIGDCEVYENISPVTLWQEYGITSYIRGSAQQLIWQSYYLLEETLRYETPKAVVFNVLSMKYNEPHDLRRHEVVGQQGGIHTGFHDRKRKFYKLCISTASVSFAVECIDKRRFPVYVFKRYGFV